MIKLIEILNQIKTDNDYLQLNNFIDQNLYETYTILGELLDPNNSYDYQEKSKGFWTYIDINNNLFFVRLIFQPTTDPYFELKTGWIDNGKPRYDLPNNSTSQDWDKRSNTVAKIYKDEIIPFFNNQTLNDTLIIKPLDIKRYQFSIRLINKFKIHNTEIIENKPKEIIIKKL